MIRISRDQRRLCEGAGCHPGGERRLLKQCKGIGEVGVDIFFREVQRPWRELYPLADGRATRAANRVSPDAPMLAGQINDVEECVRCSTNDSSDLDYAFETGSDAAGPAGFRA